MWRRLAIAGRSQSCARPRTIVGVSRHLSATSFAGCDAKAQVMPGSRRGAATQLGTYLENAGAVWGDAVDSQQVHSLPSRAGTAYCWQVDLSPERLTSLRRGEPLESPSFIIGGNSQSRARFQFFPKGDSDCEAEGMCSLWLWSSEGMKRFKLRLGKAEQASGATDFCRLEDALQDGKVDIILELEEADAPVPGPEPAVQQSLQLTGLQLAEWRIFQMDRLRESSEFVTSPPFRFHHVLLGDMYLELLFGAPHPGFCTVFFRCRVPTMKLKVELTVGSNFAKSFVSLGKSTPQDDIASSACLQVNLNAPDVLGPDGELLVRCALEEVVNLPPALKDMIPRLDERALWPKRL